MRPPVDLVTLRDHARSRANWTGDASLGWSCRDTPFASADHPRCQVDCGCECHRPTDRERALWQQETHCGCPTCGAKPHERCRTVTSRNYVPGYATATHLARIQLYEYLFKGGAA